ncbi:MAG: uncharacterized protein QG622_2931 [Actinomycetota bacterium]|nr:uncharacterized protein [Actinomycetota bacterium]
MISDVDRRRPSAAPRLREIDALRGFALLGILVVNIAFFATACPWHGVDDPAYGSPLDTAVRAVVALLFELKFYLLFSFLFGYSFTLQLASAWRSGARFVPRFLRRLSGLFVIGTAHMLLFFHGDILTTYAVLGLVLLAVHRIRPRTAMIVAGTLVALVAIQLLVVAVVEGSPPADPARAIEAGMRSAEALRGGPGDVIVEHLRSLPKMLQALAAFQAPLALAAFLVGLAAGQVGWLADLPRHDRFLRRLQTAGFPVGILGSIPFALTGGTTRLNLGALALTVVTAPWLSAAYAATVLRICCSGRSGHRLTDGLAPAGRMSLTNYLGQSVICAVIFTGWGSGLVGRTSPAEALATAFLIFCGQLLFSAYWMSRHPYGPAEWVLRTVTTMRRPAWRVR